MPPKTTLPLKTLSFRKVVRASNLNCCSLAFKPSSSSLPHCGSGGQVSHVFVAAFSCQNTVTSPFAFSRLVSFKISSLSPSLWAMEAGARPRAGASTANCLENALVQGGGLPGSTGSLGTRLVEASPVPRDSSAHVWCRCDRCWPRCRSSQTAGTQAGAFQGRAGPGGENTGRETNVAAFGHGY